MHNLSFYNSSNNRNEMRAARKIAVRKIKLQGANGLETAAHIVESAGVAEEVKQTVFWLHGLLGSSANWLQCAREVVRSSHDDWRIVLPMLRNHGSSLSSVAEPPHSVHQCANDLACLTAALGSEPRVLVGHSFGGKVALEFLRTSPVLPQQVFLLDTLPGPTSADSFGAGGLPGGMMVRLLHSLKALPDPFSKEALAELLDEQGVDSQVKKWIAGMAVMTKDKTGFRLNFCVTTALELLSDYTQKDCWDTLYNSDANSQIHMVIGNNSQRWDDELRKKLDGAAAASGSLQVHQLAKSGHWMHSDEPEAVSALISAVLDESTAQQCKES
jgi:pimeloyl-ACP methyl ester carboxylesterase